MKPLTELKVGGKFVNKSNPKTFVVISKIEGELIFYKDHQAPFKEYSAKYPDAWEERWRYQEPEKPTQ